MLHPFFTPILFLLCFTLQAQTVSTFYQNAGIDDGLAIDSEGNLYGSQYTGSIVYKITPEGEKSNFVTGLNTPNGLDFDSEGYLYVIDNQGGAIHKVAPDGTVLPYVPTIFSPSGIVKMPQSDTMIVSSWEGDKLHKVAPDGTVSDFSVGNGLEGPVGMVYDENDNLFVGNYNDRWIFQVDEFGVLDTLTRLTVPGSNIGFISYRENFIYATIPWDNKIYKVDMEGNYELYAGAGVGNTDGAIDVATFNGPNGILLSPDGERLYISDFNTRSIRVIDNLDGMSSASNFLHHSSVQQSQLIPNPVQNKTALLFNLSSPQSCTVKLYDVQGQLLKTVFENQRLPSGEQQVMIEAAELAGGIYFVALTTAAGDEVVKKMVKN